MDRISEIRKAIDRKDFLEVVPFLRRFMSELGLSQDIADSEITRIAEKVVNELEAEETARHEAWVIQRKKEGSVMTAMNRRGSTQEAVEKACSVLKRQSKKLTIDSVAIQAGISRSTAHRYYDIIQQYAD
jgi:hypothetical protein